MRTIVLLSILLFASGYAQAQDEHKCALSKTSANQRVLKRSRAGSGDNALMERYDVHWYFLNLNIERNNTILSGNVTIGANTLVPTDTFCFELNSNLHIDSIVYLNNKLPFYHASSTNICYVLPITSIPANTNIYMKIYYGGDASVVGGSAIGDGFSTNNSQTWGNSVTWSLSEPYSAREWFPCKQFLQDKADSSWVYITTDNQNKVGSNGRLQGIDQLPNNKVRYRWKSNYPIDYYLISVAVAKYVSYETYAYPAVMPNDSILIQNYIYDNPATLNYFKPVLDSTAMMIEYFSDQLGLYPFANEKYGHAMAPFSGGMEHQTMSSMGFFFFDLVAHELMHQWFGDYVTCATWSDIFINEGFASYGEYMAAEKLRGSLAATNLMANVHNNVMSQPAGSIYFTDTNDVNRIFSSRLSYDKGNAVIHTLRFELGDSVFYTSIKNFLSQYAYSNASITDFKTSVETTSGKNLTPFFNQWIYGEGYPTISAAYFSDSNYLALRVTHTVSASTPTFITPLEITCKSTQHGDTTLKVQLNSNNDTYFFQLGKYVDGLVIDPKNWILNKVGTITKDPNLLAVNTNNLDINKYISLYPNPINDHLNIINNAKLATSYNIFTLTGKNILSLYNRKTEQIIDLSHFASGVYLMEINNQAGKTYHKLIKQ